MTLEEFKNSIKDLIPSRPEQWRKGQFVFNYVDENYGVARAVQFQKGVDCFYNDKKIDLFLDICYEMVMDYLNKFQSKEGPLTLEDEILIPLLPKLPYEEYVIPKLIELGGIPKDKLEVGKTYSGLCRNTSKATWNGKEFDYERNKNGIPYQDSISHFEDGAEDKSDLFIPLFKSE